MEKFGEFLKGAKSNALAGVTGGLASGISGAVSGIIGNIGYGRRLKKQIEAQKELNEQAAKLNYEYGEKSAQNAYERMLNMYQRSYRDNSMSAMRGQAEQAGLSVGLLYGGGGVAGGGAGSTGGGIQGDTGGAEAGRASSTAEMEQLAIARTAQALEFASLKKDLNVKDAQADELRAQADAARANAGLQTEKKITEVQQREVLIEKLRQEGMEKWIKNVQERWASEYGSKSGDHVYSTKNKVYGEYSISSTGYLSENKAWAVAQATANTGATDANAQAAKALAELNSEKARTYWQVLLNAAAHADADRMRAAAAQLATEWETGEYTNWKTWADLAKNILGAIGGGAIGGAVLGKLKK